MRTPPLVFEAVLSNQQRCVLKHSGGDPSAAREIRSEYANLQTLKQLFQDEKEEEAETRGRFPCLASELNATDDVFFVAGTVDGRLYHPLSVHVGRKQAKLAEMNHTTDSHLGVAQVAAIIGQAASFLLTLHAKKYVHGDISPSNIVSLDKGKAIQIIDWAGMTRVDSPRTTLTATLLFISTPVAKALQSGGVLPNCVVIDDVEALFWTTMFLVKPDLGVFQCSRSISTIVSQRELFWESIEGDTKSTFMSQTLGSKWQSICPALNKVALGLRNNEGTITLQVMRDLLQHP
jgi:serine/threonine protein kinase